MSLEKLKSAYANITLPNDIFKKEGKKVNNNMSVPEKTGEGVNGGIKGDLTTMVSKFSIQNEPQIVDNISNEKASGFTPNYDKSLFTGIEGESPDISFSGNTLAYTDRDITWPGPVDFLSNQKSSGFTLNQEHKSPSLFEGVSGGETEQPQWLNNLQLGGSQFGFTTEPQEVDMMFNNHQAQGFTANLSQYSPSQYMGIDNLIWNSTTSNYVVDNVSFPNPVDYQTITSMWTTQLTGLNFPDGFTVGMNESELVKGYQTLTVQGEDYRNTNRYNVGNYEFTNIPGTSGVNDFYIGFNPVTTPSQYGGIPNVYDGTWNNDGMATNYYDSNHTNNPINNNFPGPVDFMSGTSLHPASLAQSGSIPGFTNNYNPGMFGGWSVNDPEGNSKILGLWNTEFLPNQMMTSLWTGYTNGSVIDFGQPVDFMSGVNSYYNTL